MTEILVPLSIEKAMAEISKMPRVKDEMIADEKVTLVEMLRAIARLTDAELLQLKAAARKEAEKRRLKESRHATAPESRRH